MKAISFSLFGTAPIYLQGALRNAELYPQLFPDWKCVFFVERESVPEHIISNLMGFEADVRMYSRAEYPNGMFVRFTIADDPTVERFIVRDCDSRPSQRERNAVQEWIDSDLNFHAMRDHPYHGVLMLGGLWGAKGGILQNVEQSIKRFSRAKFAYNRETQYGADQEWLWNNVWPKFSKSGLVHDSCTRLKFGHSVPFPDGLHEGDFVGSVFSDLDEPNQEHIRIRDEWIRNQK